MMSARATPNEYLTCFEYGMGALWAVVTADSRESILAKYPSLIILDGRPDSISRESYLQLRCIDIDNDDDVFFRAVRDYDNRD